MTSVNVLGTKYEIEHVAKLKDDHVGETNFITKKIFILIDSTQDTDAVLRHELMHAFFYEAGLLEYGNDELLMDFLAVQHDKIEQLMEEANV